MDAPAVIICSLNQAVAALNAACETATPVLLLSPQGAAASTGAALFKSLTDHATEEFPDFAFIAALDCGSDAGHALAAIREGVKAIVLSEDCPARSRVNEIARQKGVQVLPPDVYDDMENGAPLDLTIALDPLAASRAFLRAQCRQVSDGESLRIGKRTVT